MEEARVIFDDLEINEVSAMMYDMEHPYVIYKDWIVTPWIFTMFYSLKKLQRPLEQNMFVQHFRPFPNIR